MNTQQDTTTWSPNVIIADADYIDSVAFDLIVNFERMLERRIQPADLAHWIDCVALDGGVREGCGDTQVVLLHEKGREQLENFRPANYENDIHGKAFKDNLGEFSLTTVAVEELVTKDDLLLDIVRTVCADKAVQRVMAIPGEGEITDRLRLAMQQVDENKRVTIFTMQPVQGGNFRQEILGYSLMSALGISSNELHTQGWQP